MKYCASLIALISLSAALSAAPKYPFPQKATYKYGIMPTTIDIKRVEFAYSDFMELYEEQGDQARIKHDDLNNTVSEGIGYGMLVMVYMDNEKNNTQEKFDKLWKYYNSHLDGKGLMNWKISGFGSALGSGAATDAELDVAVALLQAYKQWENEKYLNDAKALIAKIAEHEVNGNGFLKPGDSWDNEKNPSYFSTAALELFKEASDFDWQKVITNSYDLIKKCQDGTTGLVPNWCNEQGSPSGGERGYYTYDATRTPWRIAWAYSWFGHEDAKSICTKTASWISSNTGNDPLKVVDGYQLNGTGIGQWPNTTFIGPFACAGMVDATHQGWIDKCFPVVGDLVEDRYYQISLKLITLLHLSGNMPDFWNYTPIGVCPKESLRKGNAIHADISCKRTRSAAPELVLSLPSADNVSVWLYTASGRPVVKLADGFCPAGEHRIAFAHAIPAGAYIVRMRTGSRNLTRPVIVTR